MRGTRLPLRTVRLAAADAESLAVIALGIRASGRDPEARIAVVHDVDRDGEADPGDPSVFVSGVEPLDPSLRDIALTLPSSALVIPAGGSVDVIIAAVLSGATPHASIFGAEVIAGSSATLGLRSGVTRTFEGSPAPPVLVATTVLSPGERVAMSANPVRGGDLVLTYASDARRIAIYDIAGRRVRTLTEPPGTRTTRWTLVDDDGRPVPNGVYVVVLDLVGGAVRRRVFVAR